MKVGEWLRSLGLGQYEETFRDSKIDFDVLGDLTDGDLEKLGVPLGDRRRLLKAIPDGRGSELRRVTPRQAPSPLANPPQDLGERRPITVMFCDLVGSTELGGGSRPGGLAQPCQCLSRRGFKGGRQPGRARPEKTGRRVDGPLRLSAGARERRRTRRPGRAPRPAGARRAKRAKRHNRRSRAWRSHRP